MIDSSPAMHIERERKHVDLQLIEKTKSFNTRVVSSYNIVTKLGEKIGSLQLESVYDRSVITKKVEQISEKPLYSYLKTIKIDQEYRDKGFGKAAVLQILALVGDSILISGNTLTGFEGEPGSYQVWLSLVRDGLAREAKTTLSDGSKKTVGFMSVPDSLKDKSTVELDEIYQRIS